MTFGRNRIQGALCCLVAGIFWNCATPHHIEQLPSTANPTEGITTLSTNINSAKTNQVDVLSPDKFARAEESLKDAKKYQESGKDNEKILKAIAEGNAWLTDAQNVATEAQKSIPMVVAARKRALDAKAGEFAKKELKEADNDLKNYGSRFESGKMNVAPDKSTALQAQFMDAELAAMKNEHLGPAYVALKSARDEGARKAAPDTYSAVEKKLVDAEAFITANRSDAQAVARTGDEVTQESQRLLEITRSAKINKNKTPEEIALEMEAAAKAQAQLKTEVTNRDQQLVQNAKELSNKEGQLKTTENERIQLETEKSLQAKYEAAQTLFTKAEAEVYKQGDSLMIRLRGLAFPKGTTEIRPAAYPLLAKVRKVVEGFGPSKVTIEGHTDSTGGAINQTLSQKRADSVKAYMESGTMIPGVTIETQGFGYDKPIASNKTAAGRAENRRVDVIITPAGTPLSSR